MVSLRRLYTEIGRHAGEFTAEAFASDVDSPGLRQRSIDTFRRRFGGGGDIFDVDAWQRRRKDFVTACDRVKVRVDKTIAHADERVLDDSGP